MRAEYIRSVREFFYQRGVVEVDVPILGSHAVTDAFVDSLSLYHQSQEYFLQTSPEYFLKRVLAAGSNDIYYLGKAFRADESSRLHHCEFTMLEWYRSGYDDVRLMDELVALVCLMAPNMKVNKFSYTDLFFTRFALNPYRASVSELKHLLAQNIDTAFTTEDRSTLFDLLFSHCIEPALPDGLVLVHDYPECQAALARVVENEQGDKVARRFEAFLDRVELANGYWELKNPNVQEKRFLDDNRRRKEFGKPAVCIDENFLDAMKYGLPDCAGVALGVDRLLMNLLGVGHISEQKLF